MSNLIAKHGGYRELKSFQMAEIVYDLTFEFINRYVEYRKDREQMEGAARGGKQNIGEGSQTSGTSKESEIRLLDVARSSQEELKLDYEDFIRKHHLPLWNKNDPKSLAVRKLAYVPNKSYKTYMTYMSDSETAANCLLCLINQTKYLLDRQLQALEKDFKHHGDFKDRYKRERKNQLFNDGPPIDDFLKSQGLRRLENGRVVSIDE